MPAPIPTPTTAGPATSTTADLVTTLSRPKREEREARRTRDHHDSSDDNEDKDQHYHRINVTDSSVEADESKAGEAEVDDADAVNPEVYDPQADEARTRRNCRIWLATGCLALGLAVSSTVTAAVNGYTDSKEAPSPLLTTTILLFGLQKISSTISTCATTFKGFCRYSGLFAMNILGPPAAGAFFGILRQSDPECSTKSAIDFGIFAACATSAGIECATQIINATHVEDVPQRAPTSRYG